MFPLRDENPTLRAPVVTYLILAMLGFVWVVVQGAGMAPELLQASVCNFGMVPGEITGRAVVGTLVPMGPGMACAVDRDPINLFTPLTSMFLHAGWAHLLGNALFLYVFGRGVEDSMGRFRFIAFYLVCGLSAAAAQVAIDPASPIPTIGASGAISGVMGAYLVLYPRVRVHVLVFLLVFVRIVPLPAWMLLVWWFGLQVLTGLPQLLAVNPEVSGGVAVFAHIGGFAAGVLLVKVFENRTLVELRADLRNRLYPYSV